MNATRAATIRLRSSFDGAVSLGRVQTPTLAILARREEEIRAFKPEPYWVVDATFEPTAGEPAGATRAASTPARSRASATAAEAEAIVAAVRGQAGAITKLETTTTQGARRRCSTTSPRCSATPTRASASPRGARSRAAQRLYEEHKALTYPRTNSRYLTGDMVAEIKPIAELVGEQPRVRARRRAT